MATFDAQTDKRDLFKTCRVRPDSYTLLSYRGQYASIKGHKDDVYTIAFVDGSRHQVHETELVEFCL